MHEGESEESVSARAEMVSQQKVVSMYPKRCARDHIQEPRRAGSAIIKKEKKRQARKKRSSKVKKAMSFFFAHCNGMELSI